MNYAYDSKYLEKIIGDLIPYAAALSPLSALNIQERLKAIKRIRGDYDINGRVESSDNWRTFDIYINDGLIWFIYKVSNLFATSVVVPEQDSFDEAVEKGWVSEKRKGFFIDSKGVKRYTSQERINRQETIAALRNLLIEFWNNNIHNTVGFDSLKLKEGAWKFSLSLQMSTLNFIVAHELGHFVVNICNKDKCSDYNVLYSSWRQRCLEAGINSEAAEVFASNYANEHAADIIGLRIVNGQAWDDLNKGASKYCTLRALAGAEFFFVAMKMIEKYGEEKLGITLNRATHPSADQRLNTIHQLTIERDPNLTFTVGQCLAGLADGYLEDVSKDILESD